MVENGHGRVWPAGEVVIAAVTRPAGKYYVLAIPQAALGGEARIESRPGEGTRVQVILPLEAPEERDG